jgi:hypothetical protein
LRPKLKHTLTPHGNVGRKGRSLLDLSYVEWVILSRNAQLIALVAGRFRGIEEADESPVLNVSDISDLNRRLVLWVRIPKWVTLPLIGQLVSIDRSSHRPGHGVDTECLRTRRWSRGKRIREGGVYMHSQQKAP